MNITIGETYKILIIKEDGSAGNRPCTVVGVHRKGRGHTVHFHMEDPNITRHMSMRAFEKALTFA